MNPKVWVCTEQRVHHGPHLAFVKRWLLDRGLGGVSVKHLYVEKRYQRAAGTAALELRRNQVDHWNAVLFFRDGECRDERSLARVQQEMEELIRGLRPNWPHCGGVIFNPMSEGAVLLCDEWMEVLYEILGRVPPEERKLLETMAREKRRGSVVCKDTLEKVARVSAVKKPLNQRWAALIERERLPDIPCLCYRREVEKLQAVLEEALGDCLAPHR